MSTNIEITLERTDAQVSVCSIDPTVIVIRDVDVSDYDALRAYATALERHDESRGVPA